MCFGFNNKHFQKADDVNIVTLCFGRIKRDSLQEGIEI